MNQEDLAKITETSLCGQRDSSRTQFAIHIISSDTNVTRLLIDRANIDAQSAVTLVTGTFRTEPIRLCKSSARVTTISFPFLLISNKEVCGTGDVTDLKSNVVSYSYCPPWSNVSGQVFVLFHEISFTM